MKAQRITFKMLILVCVAMVSMNSFGVPAKRIPITVKQPNGQQLTIVLYGDEWVNWMQTIDGYSVLKNTKGEYVYATKNSNGDMVPSTVVASNENLRTDVEKSFLSKTERNLRFSDKQRKQKMAPFNKNLTAIKANKSFPTIGTDSLLVILVYFSDLDFTYTNQDFVNMTSQANYNGTGSVKDYYHENSDGQFEMAIRVVGPYKLPHNMAYYGGNDDQYTNYTNFCQDAVAAADADVDYANFDNDGDGYVDGIHIIFAGTPESSTGTEDEIWPHRWAISPVIHDNKYISTYSCSAEKRDADNMDGIGTMTHEFGHVLGLPDNYDADYEESGGTSVTTGRYDLMASGSYNNNCNTPPYLSMGEKIITKWANIDTLVSGGDSLRVPVVTGHNDTGYYIPVGTGEEFFIIEARNKENKWDAYIPSSGMLIYHGVQSKIDGWLDYGYRINTEPSNRGWFIEPSDGETEHGDQAEAAFAGVSGITSFSPNSSNKPKLNDGTELDIYVTDIQWLNDSVMLFNYNSASASIEALTITDDDIYSNGFTMRGKVISTGNGTVQSKGFIYSLNSNINMTSGNIVYDNNLTDETNITAQVTNLSMGKYYYRAFMITTEDTVLSGIKSAYTRLVDISDPVYTDNGVNNIVATFNLTKYSSCSKYAALTGDAGVVETYANYYGVTLNEMMDYFIQQGYTDYETTSQQYNYGPYSIGDKKCLYVLAVTVSGDTVLYRKNYTINITTPDQEVTISDVDTFMYNMALAAQWTFTPNEYCIKYYPTFYEKDVIEDFAQTNNLTDSQVLDYLIENEVVTEQTSQQTFAYYIIPNVDYEIYVWAVGYTDTILYKKNFKINKGNTGKASADITLNAMYEDTAYINLTLNPSTAYYYLLNGTSDAFSQADISDTADAGAYVEQYESQLSKYMVSGSLTWAGLTVGESYTMYAIPYNSKGERGSIGYVEFTFNPNAEPPCQSETYDYYDTICDGNTYTYNGKDYTTSQTIQATYTGYAGCDSVVYMHLSVMPTYNKTNHETVMVEQMGEDYTDTVVEVLNTQYGCDSVVTTITEYKHAQSIQDVESSLNGFTVYPNPAKDVLTIELSDDLRNVNEIIMTDNMGRTVYSISDVTNTLLQINISKFEKGVYYIKAGDKFKKVLIQ